MQREGENRDGGHPTKGEVRERETILSPSEVYVTMVVWGKPCRLEQQLKAYHQLEEEFRAALRIEASRYQEVLVPSLFLSCSVTSITLLPPCSWTRHTGWLLPSSAAAEKLWQVQRTGSAKLPALCLS